MSLDYFHEYTVCARSVMSNSFATLWTIARQVPLSMGSPKQDDCNKLPCPPPGDLSDPGTKSASPVAIALQADSLPLSYQGSPKLIGKFKIFY